MKNAFYLLIILTTFACNQRKFINTMPKNEKITLDWQGHRGARGLMPENTIPAFLKALEFPIQTLELDVAVSKDQQIIVSHEPYFSHVISTKPNGEAVEKEEEKNLKIYELTYEEIQQYDVGSRDHPRFPQQQKQAVFKPSLQDLVKAVKEHCLKHNRALPSWNIEIKMEENGDQIFHPTPAEFTDLLMAEIKKWGIYEKTNLQSFDVRVLQYCKKKYPDMPLSLLVENLKGVDKNLEKLGFTPAIYSCYFKFLNKKNVQKLHSQGILVIPWTVNNSEDMKKLIEMGVDGIITDYPNLVEELDVF